MANRPSLLLLLLTALSAGLPLTASAQQIQPAGTTNTIGTVSNVNANNGAPTVTSPSASSSFTVPRQILLPNGGRRTLGNTTVIVCDDPGAPYPDVVDECSLR
jgi:hypothetical protein